jgi:hypothetical protein
VISVWKTEAFDPSKLTLHNNFSPPLPPDGLRDQPPFIMGFDHSVQHRVRPSVAKDFPRCCGARCLSGEGGPHPESALFPPAIQRWTHGPSRDTDCALSLGDSLGDKWWTQSGSNRQKSPCKGGALPAML